MKTNSPWTYIARHRTRTAILILLLALSVLGVYLLFGLFQESFQAPEAAINQYLNFFSLVEEKDGQPLPDRAALESPLIRQIVPYRSLEIGVPNVGGLVFYIRLLGLNPADAGMIFARTGAVVAEGRLPAPGTNGVALSRQLALALDLQIGDTFDQTMEKSEFFPSYAEIVSPLKVVGLLDGPVRLGILSLDFLETHPQYRMVSREGWIVLPQSGSEIPAATFLNQVIGSEEANVTTGPDFQAENARSQAALNALFLPILMLVTGAVALVVGAINQMAFFQRMPALGVLHAVGHSKKRLARLLALETAFIALIGWALGTLAALGGMRLLSHFIYGPRGFPFQPFQLRAFLLVSLMPLAVMVFTLLAARRSINRMDTVAVLEKKSLGFEKKVPRREARRPKKPQTPLSAFNYLRRHRRQSLTLIGVMALMIVGTALLVFVVETVWDASSPVLNILRPIGRVSPISAPLEPAQVERIRQHPSVSQVIECTTAVPLTLTMPLIRDDISLETVAVQRADMLVLMELYDLVLAAGRLPEPGAAEIVIPWTAAQNRGIKPGAVIGDPDSPLYPGAPDLPTPLTVSGIFAPAQNPGTAVWLSFTSYEFAHENPAGWSPAPSLLVIPAPGQKAAVDAWLEARVADEQTLVMTYDRLEARLKETLNTALFGLGLMESIVAVMAALALAGLNYIFTIQRRRAFGVLYALGFSRRQLIQRTLLETLLLSGAAWLTGVVACLAVLVYLQLGVYAPLGLRIHFFNPAPWLYTLPVPVAVFLANALVLRWIFSRLDAIAVIEHQ